MRIVTTGLSSALLALVLGAPFFGAAQASAQAQSSVIVLGLRSVEGDDDVANALTDSLRDAAHGVASWQLLDRAVSMAQMSLAHGCDDIDANCLSEIAKGLNVDHVVYGTIRRTSARAEYDYQITLSIFDAASGSIGATETDIVPRGQAENPDALRPRAIALMQRLSGNNAGAGMLTIQTNAPSAEVRLDGQIVGMTRDGVLVTENVAPGQHALEVSAPGYSMYREPITVSATGPTTVVAQLSGGATEAPSAATNVPASRTSDDEYADGKKGKSLKWLGYTLIGVGGASLIGVGVSMLEINGINGDATFKKYSKAVDPSLDDICAEAEKGHNFGVSDKERRDVVDMCSRGATFEVLQWVFLGTALISGGVGAYILATDKERTRGESARAQGPAFALSPAFGQRSASLTARVAF